MYSYISRLGWAGDVARMEEDSTFKIFTGKPTGRKPLGRPSFRWEDSIKRDLKEIYIDTRNWVDSAKDRN